MKVRLFLHVLFFTVSLFAFSSFAQNPGASLSPKLVTASCGKAVCTWNAFGPSTYARQTGNPEVVTATFSVQNVNTQYTMHIDNDGVASAVISVNGAQVFGPGDFNPGVTTLDRSVTLAAGNTLSVELRSKPGTSLVISIIGVDNDPPSIAELASPISNAFGWNNTDVGVSFLCSDATSGIAICPASFVLTSEGLNQIAQGTAFDLAGNSTTSSIQISIDKTPPAITASQRPSPNSANWNNTPVMVNFSCTDKLSGVQSCNAPVTVATEGANQSVSGKAVDFAGNSASTQASVNIDLTPPSISIASPANGASVSAAKLQLTGSVSDNLSGVAAVSCNGTPASVTSGSFSCNITLASGSNSIQVQATDIAGNAASTQLSVTFNPIPVVPPKAIFITPTMASLLSGQTRTVKLVGDIGQLVTGAKWTISDSSVATITPNDPPQLTALTPGTATLTASFGGLSASMTVNVFSGTALPVGTPIWSVDPTPGNTVMQMIRGNPLNSGDPDIYAIEFPNMLRAFTQDGQQLWTVKLDHLSPVSATPAIASQLSPSSLLLDVTVPPVTAGLDMPDLPEPFLTRVKAHLGPEPLQRFFQRYPQFAAKMQALNQGNQPPAISASVALVPNTATTTASAITETDFLVQSTPDNNGGTVNLIFRRLSAFPFELTTVVRIDNATQQPSWSYDSPGLVTGIAIAPDNTVYETEFFSTGPTQGCCSTPSRSDVLALDGATGQQKFKLAVPSGHVTITKTTPFGVSTTDLETDAKLGLPSVFPDGSVKLLAYTALFSDTFGFGLSGGCSQNGVCETGVSDHKKLELLTIQPDGSSSTQPVQAFDFEKSNCGAQSGGCQDPSSNAPAFLTDPFNVGSFVPKEVIPDGLGGTLAAWELDDVIGNSPFGAHIRHFDDTGAIVDYAVPLLSNRWQNFVTSTSGALILGQNNIAFASDGISIVASDGPSGVQQWTSQPGGRAGETAVASSTDGGVLGYTTDPATGNVNAIQRFDAVGTPTVFPVTGALANLSFFDASTLLATTSSGQAQLVAGVTFQPSFGLWFTQGGNDNQRAPVSPAITSISPPRGEIQAQTAVTISGTGFGLDATVSGGSNLSVSNVKVFSSTKLTALFQPNDSGSGNQSITVTVNGANSVAASFYGQRPIGDRIIQTLSDGPSTCTSGQAGWTRSVAVILVDQENPPQDILAQGTTVNEFVSASLPNDLNITSFTTGTTQTNFAGQFRDTYGFCSPLCPTNLGKTVAIQTFQLIPPSSANRIPGTMQNNVVFKCTGITINGQ